MGGLDLTLIVDDPTDDGVVIEPVGVDQPVERAHHLAGRDVDHVARDAVERAAPLDDRLVTSRVEAERPESGRDEVGDRSRAVEAPAGDDRFVVGEADQFGPVTSRPECAAVAVLRVEEADRVAAVQVVLGEAAVGVAAVERASRLDQGEVGTRGAGCTVTDGGTSLLLTPEALAARGIDMRRSAATGGDQRPVAQRQDRRQRVGAEVDRAHNLERRALEHAQRTVGCAEQQIVACHGDRGSPADRADVAGLRFHPDVPVERRDRDRGGGPER